MSDTNKPSNRSYHLSRSRKVVFLVRSLSNQELFRYISSSIDGLGIATELNNLDRFVNRPTTPFESVPFSFSSLRPVLEQDNTYAVTDILWCMYEACCFWCATGNPIPYDDILTTFGRDNVAVLFPYQTRFSARMPTYLHEAVSQLCLDGLVKSFSAFEDSAADKFEEMVVVLKSRGVEFDHYTNLSTWAKEFLENFEAFKGASGAGYLRLYVPNEKYQAEQIETFVRLFENYLNKIERCPVRVDTSASAGGKLFIFKMQNDGESTVPPDLGMSMKRFDAFMALCNNNPLEAQQLIGNTGIPPSQSAQLITKFGKQYNRLLLDSRQEFEARHQMLRHALQSEAMELEMGGSVSGCETVESRTVGGILLPVLGARSVVINVNGSEQVQSIIGAVKDRILGSGAYTPEEQEAIQIIHEHAKDENELISLKSDIDQLKDESVDQEIRKGAWQRLQAFGSRNSKAAFEVMFKVAFDYFASKAEGKS